MVQFSIESFFQRHHTLVSVTSSKLIYSFGCGTQGQLGNGEMIKQSVPFSVDLPTECNQEYTIEKIIAGENHSFALFFKELESKVKSNPSRGALTLNDRMIDRWLSATDSCWATIKQEINTVFSSAASLNGSFLEMNCDDHYQTSEEHCGLDFDLVKTSFAKLSKNKSLISEVEKVVEQMLRSLNPNPTGVESLRVYLLLPELIRLLKKHRRTELTEALASKILQLDPDAHKVLEKYWSKLPDDWLKSLVKLFRKASAELIGQMSFGKMGYDLTRRLKKFLNILQMIYQVCCSANRDIPNRDFIIHEISDLLDTLKATLEDLLWQLLRSAFTDDFQDMLKLKDYYLGTINILVKFPFAADTASKRRMFHVSARHEDVLSYTYCMLYMNMPNNYDFKQKRLKKFLNILQMIYQVCCSANRDIPNRDFIIHEISDLLDTLQATFEDLLWQLLQSAITDDFQDMQKLKDYYLGTINILVKFPFAADTASKRRMFHYLQWQLFRPRANGNVLHIKRESVWLDTLTYLKQKTHAFRNLFRVTFIGENGIDMRGLSAEFFSLLSQSLLKWEKKVLEVHESSLVWFNPDGMQANRDFYYLGVICGMALYNRHYINIGFPLALFKKLLQQSPTLNDLEELSPVEARSLKSLLEEEEDEVVDMLFLDFTVKGKKLIPNGDQIQVTKVNRQKYVDLYVNFVFNKSVKKQFKHFSRGFFKGCPLDAWSMFHPEELQELLHGSPEYEWKELQQCASYEKCSASDELIKNFWTVFFELSEENKRKFLIFLYGTDRVPVGGFSKRSLKILLSDCPDVEDRLPEAQTCFGRLILPKYSDINTLRNKLIHAISFCEVFGRE
ncbi:probable E3 ubiquitin-protein ligase HERC4 [Sinocyclocheilus grahami]|uniref:probable E3 ubiquitin-protein ligase HERC4 n=1 Tax=Sinocyclocheilus grahami TaxID=75366 RepID=UPI0007AD42C3|nr:PREDICTED: probable E3 ubiquitin-protein ligase HERC4 [Sinocyclocheilus grahami]